MGENAVLEHISQLVDEERRLRGRVMSGDLAPDEERARLSEIEKSLDQCWDLLRRRRVAENQGNDPNSVTPRPKDEVEDYLQ